jgi:uncharacterized membrane protein YphA (DoxX/SURF4 family)
VDPVLIWTAAILLSGLFLSAGWHKTGSPAYYRDLISGYTGLPAAWAGVARNGVALVELAAGILLLVPASRNAAAWGAFGLLSGYSLVISVSLARGLEMDCGCSGPNGGLKLSPWLLFRNLVLIMSAWLLTYPASNRLTGLVDCLIILCSSAALILIYLAFEQLLSNREKLALLRNR